MLTIDTIPLWRKRTPVLLVFSMRSMLAATITELIKLQTVGRVLFIFRRHIITALASRTLQRNIISRHFSK